MTAQVTNRPAGRIPEPMSGDSIAYHRRNTPGTLWERVGERRRVAGCVCAHNVDGSTTTMLCPVHSDTDPCERMARVTGKRRKGTIRRGVCTKCGWGEHGRSALERAKAAHPAGKGITHEEVQQ